MYGQYTLCIPGHSNTTVSEGERRKAKIFKSRAGWGGVFKPCVIVCVCVCWPQVSVVISSLEDGLQLLCLTGVEDQMSNPHWSCLGMLQSGSVELY